MPIPIILAAGALALAGVGVKKGIDAKNNFDEAGSVVRRAEEKLEAEKERIERHRQQTQFALEDLGRKRLAIEANTIRRFLTAYKRVRNVNYKDLDLGEMDIRVTADELKQMEATSAKAAELARVGVEALGAGALAGLGAGGLASMVGVASTGTAISSLAGVAATNATLAWLGGGALSAGGMGMAGGMAVLGGLVAGPALAVIGFAAAAKSEQALTQAYEHASQIEQIVAQLESGISLLNAIQTRIGEVSTVLTQLEVRLEASILHLESEIGKQGEVEYNAMSARGRDAFETMMLLGMALNKVLKVNLLSEDGTVNPQTEVVIDVARAALQ